jgi:hypothetical protein
MLIDTLGDLPTFDGLHHLMAEIAFKKDLKGYLDAYGGAIARSLRVDPKDFYEQISHRMLMGLLPGALAEEIRALPLKPDTIERWLGKNAVDLFGIG